MPSPSPCSELPFPSQLLQIYCLAWCLVLWVYPFGLYDSASSLLFLFCGKINFQKHLDYFFPFFKTFCCVAPYSDVNQVPLLFILLHWVWISPWEAKGLSPPLGQSIAGIMPFWVLEAPSPEAVSAKHTQTLGSHSRMFQPFIYAQADFNLQQSLLFLSFQKYSWVLPLHSLVSLVLTRALCSCGSDVPGHGIHTVQETLLPVFSAHWSRTPLILVMAFVTHFYKYK